MLSLTGLVQRLLRRRCASFMNATDLYLLVSGHSGFGGFEKVGTCNEKPPLTLDSVLSYDEIKLSAFLSVSSHSEFLNDGNRYNAGSIEPNKERLEREGVVVGIIGGRFERPGVMEWQDVIVSQEQNTRENGYGTGTEVKGTEVKGTEVEGTEVEGTEEPTIDRATDYRRIWREFYEEKDFRYDQIGSSSSKRFHVFGPHYFDNLMMRKRYAISFDTLLLESEARAAAVGRQVYVHVVGIGLGVWKAVDHQRSIFLETFGQRLEALMPQLGHVGCVHFSWFHVRSCGKLKDGGFLKCAQHPNGGIRTLLSDRNPADKLPPEMENMLVVVSYAWDANALPGNEFWKKMLTATGDTSTACSTLIAELHNPHINETMVSGDNLHVATLEHGIMHIAAYSKHIMAQNEDEPKK